MSSPCTDPSIPPRDPNRSPFLQNLPPELRTPIYGYVLGGGKILHMGHRDRSYQLLDHWICDAAVTDEDICETFETNAMIVAGRYRHSSCRPCSCPDRGDARLSLALFKTCRLVYSEAALIPYAENTFSFGNPFPDDDFVNWDWKTFDMFIDRATEQQRGAIRSLILTEHFFRDFWLRLFADYSGFHFHVKAAHLVDLERLARLTIILEADELESIPHNCPEVRDGVRTVAQIKQLGNHPQLKSVRVCWYAPSTRIPAENKEWCRRLERKFLEGDEKTAKLYKRRERRKQREAKALRIERSRNAESMKARATTGLRRLGRKSYP